MVLGGRTHHLYAVIGKRKEKATDAKRDVFTVFRTEKNKKESRGQFFSFFKFFKGG
jgi:hypothetical protein